MFKHIIGQAFIQIALLLVFIFEGPKFIFEVEDSYDTLIATFTDNYKKYYADTP